MKKFLCKLIILTIFLSFMVASPVLAQDYICPTDNSNWGGDTAGCAAFCTEPCVSEWYATHKECQNNACVTVQSTGTDLCQTDTDCVSSTTTTATTTTATTTTATTTQVISINIPNPINATSFEALIGSITNFIFVVCLALSSLMIVIAGYYFITSSGDPKKVDTAKKIILYTLIGLGIIFFAKAAVSILKAVLGTTS